MKIAIELNNVIRDINTQVLDYYVKDIDKSFDKKNINKNMYNFINQIPFEDEKKRDKFMYEDYVYEIFGCAGTYGMHLPNTINTWHLNLKNEHDLMIFSLMESGLSIQSSYFFLSKIGCKIREVFFPKKYKELWDKCDIIITANQNIARNKPKDKYVVLIQTDDNKKYRYKADLVYDSLNELLLDEDFFKKISTTEKQKTWFLNRIVNFLNKKLKKLF